MPIGMSGPGLRPLIHKVPRRRAALSAATGSSSSQTFSFCMSSLTLCSEIDPKLQTSHGDGHPHVRHSGSIHHLMRRSHLRHQIAQQQCTVLANFVSERAIGTPTSNPNLKGFNPEANPSGGDGEETASGGGGGQVGREVQAEQFITTARLQAQAEKKGAWYCGRSGSELRVWYERAKIKVRVWCEARV